MAKNKKAPISLKIPDPIPEVKQWLIFGLDPSLSRTGYSVMLVDTNKESTSAKWISVGSLKPESANAPVWVRSKAIALALRDRLGLAMHDIGNLDATGIIISFEFPTPGNDFLTSISRILHLILLEPDSPVVKVSRVYTQMTNAATLRSLMGLTMRGAKNKVENITRAYSFLDKQEFGNLDSDACDGVLMAMMSRHVASILLGYPKEVPERFLAALCNSSVETVGRGRNQHTRIKGILHRPEYFSTYQRKEYEVRLRDARVKTTRLERQGFLI